MLQLFKTSICMILWVVFITPVHAQAPSGRAMKKVGKEVKLAYRACTKTVLHCMDKCSVDIDHTLPPCQENCVKAADSCAPSSDIKNSHYQIMNAAALARLKTETDACFRTMLVDARKCDTILDLTKRIECVVSLPNAPKGCVSAAYGRFQKSEKSPKQ